MAKTNDKPYPRNAAETQFCVTIARLAQQQKIPLERAVELFGHMARTMVDHDCRKRGDTHMNATQRYVSAFVRGMGADEIEVDVVDADTFTKGTLQ